MAGIGFIIIVITVVCYVIGLGKKENRSSPKYLFNLVCGVMLIVLVCAVLLFASSHGF